MCNFWLPPNLITNSLPLTRSLTSNINSWLAHFLYVTCIGLAKNSKTILLDCIVTIVISVCIKRKLIKIGSFCAAILILKMEENMQHFQHIMLYYFKKGRNTTEMQNKICAVYGEGAVTAQTSKVVCEVSWYNWHIGQTILCCGAVLCTGRWLAAPLASTHYMPITGDGWHTQYIQINKVIGENEKCVFYFMQETKQSF